MAERHPKHPKSHGCLELGRAKATRAGEAFKAAGSTPSGRDLFPVGRRLEWREPTGWLKDSKIEFVVYNEITKTVSTFV